MQRTGLDDRSVESFLNSHSYLAKFSLLHNGSNFPVKFPTYLHLQLSHLLPEPSCIDKQLVFLRSIFLEWSTQHIVDSQLAYIYWSITFTYLITCVRVPLRSVHCLSPYKAKAENIKCCRGRQKMEAPIAGGNENYLTPMKNSSVLS